MASTNSYIVTVRKGHDPHGVAKGHDLKPKKVWKHALNGFCAELTDEDVEKLRKNPHVKRVEENFTIFALDLPWGLDRINQRTPVLDGLYTAVGLGEDVDVYVIDSGIRDTHEQFRNPDGSSRVRLGYDVFGEDARDYHGHGTHVFGIIGGNTVGVAPRCRGISARILNPGGYGSWDGYISAADWIIADVEASGAVAVVNASIGGPRIEAANAATDAMVKAGILVFVAAGNDSDDASNHSPASAELAVTVGASGLDSSGDFRAGFSNFGPMVDIFAPGVGIRSAYHTSDTAEATMSGTSMACPAATGVGAIARGLNRTATPAEVLARMLETATQGVVQDDQGSTRDLLYSLMDSVQEPDVPVVNQPPKVDFSWIETAPRNFSFTPVVTDDGQIIRSMWGFGDGQVSGQLPGLYEGIHGYQAPGDYTVTLEVTDNERAPGHAQKVLTVVDPNPEPEPEPEPERTLTGTVVNQKGNKTAVLTYTGFKGTSVHVKADGVRISTAPNNGTFPHNFGKGRCPIYQVCEVDASACSPEWTK